MTNLKRFFDEILMCGLDDKVKTILDVELNDNEHTIIFFLKDKDNDNYNIKVLLSDNEWKVVTSNKETFKEHIGVKNMSSVNSYRVYLDKLYTTYTEMRKEKHDLELMLLHSYSEIEHIEYNKEISELEELISEIEKNISKYINLIIEHCK